MAELIQIPYKRQLAAAYANEWAYRRNPDYYDFSKIGGDCTNFASQCILAGCGVMNYRSTYGWYYRSLRDRAPSWTSVTYLYRFLTTNQGPGPYGRLAELSEAEPGDIVQLRFLGNEAFGHSPVITSVGEEPTLDSVLVAAHSMDCGSRPLSTYKNLAAVRVIHLEGARRWRA